MHWLLSLPAHAWVELILGLIAVASTVEALRQRRRVGKVSFHTEAADDNIRVIVSDPEVLAKILVDRRFSDSPRLSFPPLDELLSSNDSYSGRDWNSGSKPGRDPPEADPDARLQEPEQGSYYRVGYATNRAPIDPNDISVGYSGKRGGR